MSTWYQCIKALYHNTIVIKTVGLDKNVSMEDGCYSLNNLLCEPLYILFVGLVVLTCEPQSITYVHTFVMI